MVTGYVSKIDETIQDGGQVKTRACTAKGGVSRPGARVLRLLLGAMADGSGDDGGGIRQRAALGPSGLTPLKAKRPAAEQPTDEGAERAAGDEPAPSSDSTIVMAIDEDAGAIAGSGTAPAAAAPAAPAAAAVSAGSSGQNSIISDTTEVRTRAGGASPCDVGVSGRVETST